MKKLALLIVAVLVTGCAYKKSVDVVNANKITSPKIVAMMGAREPWVYEIENRLRKRGFQIKRLASKHTSTEAVSSKKTITYKEATSRYVLIADGHAPNDSWHRCLGGGYKFDYVDIELVDIESNETIAHYSNSGYSEDCPPFSQTIFEDIENMVSSAWGN